MKYRRRKFMMGLVICLACFHVGGNHKLQASAVKKQDISLVQISKTKNGGKLAAKPDKEKGIYVHFSTKKEKKGYYTAFLYTEQHEILEDRDVLSYHISTKKKLRMNVNINVKGKEKALSIEDGTQILMKEDKGTLYECSTTEYGIFEVPAGFTGRVYLPIKTKERLQSEGFGLVTVLEQDHDVTYTVNSMILSNQFEMKESLFQKPFFPSEETSVEIPLRGEYYYWQEVRSKSEPKKKIECKFYLEEQTEGIRLDEDGRLWVSDHATADTFTVCAQINKHLLFRYQVSVVDSWLKSMEYRVVQNFLVKEPADVEPVPTVINIPYHAIRWGALVFAVLFSMFYIMVIKGKVR